MPRRLGMLVVGLALALGALTAPSYADGPLSVAVTRFTGGLPSLDALPVITSGDSPGSKVQASVTLPEAATSMTWSLTDTDGAMAVGPIAVAPVESAPDDGRVAYWVSMQPDAAADHALPDGAYTLTIDAAGSDGASFVGTLPLTLAASPPKASAPPVTVTNDKIYDPATDGVGWRLPLAGIDYDGPTTFVVRNRRGQVVDSARGDWADGDNPDDPDANIQFDGGSVWFDSYAPAAYSIQWRADQAHERAATPGVYSATLTIPDSYGRPVTVRLGKVDYYLGRQRTRSQAVVLTRTIHHTRLSRSVPVPAVPASADLEQIDVRAHLHSLRGRARAALRARLPGLTTWKRATFHRRRGWVQVLSFHSRLGSQVADLPDSAEIRLTNRTDRALAVGRCQVRVTYWYWYLPK